MGFLRKVPWGHTFLIVVLSLLGTAEVEVLLQGRHDWLTVAMLVGTVPAVVVYALRIVYRFRFAPAEELRWPREDFDWRVQRLREILPEEMPPGWSAPVRVRGTAAWNVETAQETLAVVLVRRSGLLCVRMTVTPREGAAAVSDAQCSEILRHMRTLIEVAEAAPHPRQPEARVWYGSLTDPQPCVPVPDELPVPRARPLPASLVALRQHLPRPLPPGWSVPMALTSDQGTGWKQGAWAYNVDDQLVLVCLCSANGRVKLMVALIRGDGSRASESAALDVLRHFRHVGEFVEEEAEEIPGGMLYLGEVSTVPTSRSTADLN